MAKLTHVIQPTPTSCAQACASMVLNRPLERVLEELPHTMKVGTKHRALIKYLKHHGLRCSDRFLSAHTHALPSFCIVRVTWSKTRAHLIVKDGDIWHDPLFVEPFKPWLVMRDRQYGKGRVTSFVEINNG